VFLDAVKPTGNFGIQQMKFGFSFGIFEQREDGKMEEWNSE